MMAFRFPTSLPALAACLLWTGLAAAEGPSEPAAPPVELGTAPAANGRFRPIFDGRTLDGWEGDKAWWKVEDGAITGEIPDGGRLDQNQFLWWKGEVADFELAFEYRITGQPSGNSGIQYRSERLPNGHAKGYQADLDNGSGWLGRIYEEEGRGLLLERGTRVAISPTGEKWVDVFAPPTQIRDVARPDAWNRYAIRARGSHVTLWINGVLAAVLDDRDAKHAKYAGRLSFQLHSDPGPVRVQFRNVMFLDLGATPPPAPPPSAVAADEQQHIPTIPPRGPNGEDLNLGFERGTLENWTATGEAFAGQPVQGDAVAIRRPGDGSGQAGEFWIGGFEKTRSDEAVGTLESAPFAITHPWASFLIGGGGSRHTRVEILDDATGKPIAMARGTAGERMRREVIDLAEFQGKRIRVRIVDDSKGLWGHVNFDDFVFHETKPEYVVPQANPEQGFSGGRTSPVLWHLVPNPAPPSPVENQAARKSAKGTKVTPGFRFDLVAAEPTIHQPIAFTTDERGRIWVVEAHSYPNRRPAGEGLDRIVILADEDTDGHYETRRVFVEGLNLASGIELGFGGVWVGAAPHLLFFPDGDGDGRPDGEPEVMLDGWGYQDTHETLNSFTWGPDGWLYGNQGVFTSSNVGKPGCPEAERRRFNAGVWRFHPQSRRFEVFALGGSNQWGLDFNEVGDAFMTHCRSYFGGGGTTHVIRNGHFWNQANSGFAPFICNNLEARSFAPGMPNFLPAAARYDGGEGGAGKPGTGAVYGGHSPVGTMVYQGDNWPEIYRGHLFTNNLHGRQINHQEAVRAGSGYEVFPAGFDILFNPDFQYLAVDLQCGPDGSVLVSDWCDEQHCHVHLNEKWDRSNGRLYRVAWADTWKPVKVDLGKLSDADLVALHGHRNQWHVRTARRLLQARAAAGRLDAAAVEPLRQAAGGDDPRAALEAIWTLHVTGNLPDEALAAAAAHASEYVRGWAVTLATETPGSPRLPGDTLVKMAATDPAASVRRNLASSLPALPDADRWRVAEALAARAEDAEDRFLPKLTWTGLADLVATDVPRAMRIAASTPQQGLGDSVRWFVTRLPAGRDALVAEIAASPAEEGGRLLRLLGLGVEYETSLPAPAGWEPVAAKYADTDLSGLVDRLSTIFGDTRVMARMRDVLADAAAPAADRRRALDLLRRSGDREALPIYVKLLGDPGFRKDLIPLVRNSSDPAVANILLAAWPTLDDAERRAALDTLTSKPLFALPLLQALLGGVVADDQIHAVHRRALRGLGDPEITRITNDRWGKVNDSPAALKARMAHLEKRYQESPHWAIDRDRGREVFARNCSSCHMLEGKGGSIGQNLTGSGRNGVRYFIENIVDPNSVIGPQYQMSVITTDDGTVTSGIVTEETPTAIVVRTLTDSVTIPIERIEERTLSPVSMMPMGLLDPMPEDDVLALLHYLVTRP